MISEDLNSNVRAYTRQIEFDYIRWTMNAIKLKFTQFSLGTSNYIDEKDQKALVLDYIDLVREIQTTESQLGDIYTDPHIEDQESAATPLSQKLDQLYEERLLLGPLAESILQNMMTLILDELEFTFVGQTIPPLLYHSSPLPWALIVSPREIIRQDTQVHLETQLNVEDHIELENKISEDLEVSTLVVPIGGVGVYPTMVAQTTNLRWLASVVAHEWIHNYLNIRPLGLAYSISPELRTINETTASIAGDEIGDALIAKFFPEFLPPPPPPELPEKPLTDNPLPPAPPVFDFRAEMRETRNTADSLLEEGKIEEAEDYMEARRLIFWENGYRIRKLNQAYFAFHGAYADVPGGAAGEDPVGAAVRFLRSESLSLQDFVKKISRVNSYEELKEIIGEIN
ncbi:MAG: hypothetical protein HOF10_04380 [Chloroflexi bacterium]|nr:hypothetical protein [Chloroflexota bacterium]MBT4304359.1 hypothetical protein [Chloroflexota bacterium]MBT5336214.1 hypothetical protein [Chloroflexota bacterium]MBT6989013.1 hypothetical protein [Chloroflexota bacterium]